MPTTRPGYIWSGTEWVAIGQEAVINPFYYQATAPTSPATGAIWVESDVDVPSVDSAQFLRWRKTMTGGETSLSGNDDSSLPLAYTPGYEQLYINGVLQVRGQDYTATTGTTVTGLTALVANDVVEIFSAVARTVADVYTQTQSDARFVNRNVGGLNLVVPTSVTAGSGTASVSSNGAVTFSGASSVSINGCFSSTYDNYQITLQTTAFSGAGALFTQFRLRNTSDDTSATWYTALAALSIGNSTADPILGVGATQGYLPYTTSAAALTYSPVMEVMRPFLAAKTSVMVRGYYNTGVRDGIMHGVNQSDVATSYSGISFFPNTGTFTGTIRIYGYNNGA